MSIIHDAASAVLARTPAVSIAVRHGNEYAEGGFGLISPETSEAARASSIYWIASATKPFTAAAIMRLVDDGKLALDDPIRKFLPSLTTTATVRQLLNQTAGLAEYTEYLDPYGATTAEQVLNIVRTKPVKFQPGASFAYSNTGYYLLGLIIENVTGMSWADAMSSMIFVPYGLTSTAQCGRPPAFPTPHGYNSVSPAVAVAPSDPSAPFAAGSLCSSASDLVRFSRLLASGQFISPESYALMTTPTRLPDGSTIAYGFGIDLHLDGTSRTIGHDGLIRGFQSVFEYYADDDLTIAVLVNRNGSGIATSVLADIVRRVRQ